MKRTNITMAIGARIVMIMLPFILCLMQLSHSMQPEGCTRTNQQTVKDILGLTKKLFDEQTNVRLIFPNPFPTAIVDFAMLYMIFIPLLRNS